MIVHRCLVGDASGKSYGDVAFIEHHSLQANILSKIYKRAILKEHAGALLYNYTSLMLVPRFKLHWLGTGVDRSRL